MTVSCTSHLHSLGLIIGLDEKHNLKVYGCFPFGLGTGVWLATINASMASPLLSHSSRPVELLSDFDGNCFMFVGGLAPASVKICWTISSVIPGGALK